MGLLDELKRKDMTVNLFVTEAMNRAPNGDFGETARELYGEVLKLAEGVLAENVFLPVVGQVDVPACPTCTGTPASSAAGSSPAKCG